MTVWVAVAPDPRGIDVPKLRIRRRPLRLGSKIMGFRHGGTPKW